MRQLNARYTIALATALIAAAAPAFAADATLVNLVMPDAQVVAGVNVTTAENSLIGSFLLGQISGNDQGLQQLITQSGFDPRRDVSEVLAASNGKPTAPSALVMSKGNFDVTKIVAAIGTGGLQQVSMYRGATLITVAGDAKIPHAIAFLGTDSGTVVSVAIAGDLASVKAAIDRSGSNNVLNKTLADQVTALSTSEDVWSVSLASLSALLPGGAATASPTDGMATQALKLVKNIQSCSAGLKFGANILFTAQATADTAQDAAALGDVIKMVASLAAMSAGTNKDVAAIAQLLQSLNVTTAGSTVNLSASVPESQIEALLNTALTPHAVAPKARKM